MLPFHQRHRRAFTLIELMLVVAMIAILSALALPNLIESRKMANEAAAISTIRAIHGAQVIYRERNADGAHGTLTDLGNMRLIEELLQDGQKSGYRFSVQPGTDCKGAGGNAGDIYYLYYIEATPVLHNQSGNRYFYSDQSGVIYTNFTSKLSPADNITKSAKPLGKK